MAVIGGFRSDLSIESFSTDVFDPRTSTGSLCSHFSTFSCLTNELPSSHFSIYDLIFWTKSELYRSKRRNFDFRLTSVAQKRLCLSSLLGYLFTNVRFWFSIFVWFLTTSTPFNSYMKMSGMLLILFYLNDSVGLTKKRYFFTTSMLCDRYSGFPPWHGKPTKCFKGACLAFYRIAPCLSTDVFETRTSTGSRNFSSLTCTTHFWLKILSRKC